ESEGSGTSGARSMSSDSTVPLLPDHPHTHTTPILVPILRRTAQVVAMPDSAFRKRFRSSYDSSPSPTLLVRKRYRGTSELILGDDSEEIDESSDFDSESEDAEDEGPTAKDEDPAAGDEGLAMGVEGPGVDDESYGLDDESHGLDDESRGLEDDGHTESEPFGNPLPEDLYKSYGLDDESYGLDDESHDDDGHGLESDGLGLKEEVVPEGQQQGALIMRTTV
nr:hypothetical protein [Tanacetum cinerariifolium]